MPAATPADSGRCGQAGEGPGRAARAQGSLQAGNGGRGHGGGGPVRGFRKGARRMRITFLADLRSPIAIQWIRHFVERGHEVQAISSYPISGNVLPGAETTSLPSGASRGLRRSVSPIRSSRSGWADRRLKRASRSGQRQGGWRSSGVPRASAGPRQTRTLAATDRTASAGSRPRHAHPVRGNRSRGTDWGCL